MKQKSLALGIILMFVGTCILPAIAHTTEKPQSAPRGIWLYVGGSGPGNYTRIYYALLDAQDGDTIFVYKGFYREAVFIELEITLIGEDKYSTIIEGEVRDEASHVTITGFTIQNDTGLSLTPGTSLNPMSLSNVSIHDLILKDNVYGIEIYNVDKGEIYNNTIRHNKQYGISIIGGTGENLFHNNTIINNPIGIDLYIVEYGTNIFRYNDIQSNDIGIQLFFKYSVDSITSIQSNNFINNHRSVKSYSSMKVQDVIDDPTMLHPKETWDANYWGAWKIPLPRPICSFTSLYFKGPDTASSLLEGERMDFGRFPSLYFDRNPAQEPYDIGG